MAEIRTYVGLDYCFSLLTLLRVLLSLIPRHFKICALYNYRWFQNNSSTLYFNFRRRLRNALCKDVPGGCSHHTNQARIYLKNDTKAPRGLYFNPAQFYLNGFASFDSTKEKFEVLSSSRDSLSLTAIKGDGRLNTRRKQLTSL